MKFTNKWMLNHHHIRVKQQLETDQRTYGSINREVSPAFAGWKHTPVTDLVAVLEDERVYGAMLKQQQLKTRRLEEEEKDGEQRLRKEST